MAFTFEPNRIFNRTVDLILDFKDRWVANGGATVLQSADGNAIAPANLADLNGDVCTVASSVNGTPNSIGNSSCWMRIQRPDGREFILQHGFFTGQNGYAMWYSRSAGFVQEAIGPISATVRPTASDETQIMGSSGLSTTVSNRPFFSDGLAGPGFPLPSDYIGRQVAHYCWGDVDEDYSFYALSWIRGARELRGGMFIDIPAVPIAPAVDAAVIGIIGDENNPIGEFSGLWHQAAMDGTPDGSNRRAYCWFDAVNTGPNVFSMPSCALQHLSLGSTAVGRYDQANPYSYPSNGIVIGASDWSADVLTEPAYDDFGPIAWELSWRQSSFGEGRRAVIGLSRLFRSISNGSRYRDITSDLLWRTLGVVAMRWDGVTNLRIA